MNNVLQIAFSTPEQPRTAAGQGTSGTLTLPEAIKAANQVTLWPPNRRRASAPLRLVVSRPVTAAEMAVARRLLASPAIRLGLRLHPWLRALDLALTIYQMTRPDTVTGIPAQVSSGVVPNLAWEKHPSEVERSEPYEALVYAATPTNWSTHPGSTVYRVQETAFQADLGKIYVYANKAYRSRIEYRAAQFGARWIAHEAIWRADVSGLANGKYLPDAVGIPPFEVENFQTYFDVPFSPIFAPKVPHRLVSQVDRWREVITPRPDEKPLRESPPQTIFAPLPVRAPEQGTSVLVRPGARPRPGQQHRPKPPGKGEKERKGIASIAVAKAAMNAVTESVDAIEAVWYALPAHMRTPKATPQQMLLDLYRNIGSVDINTAVWNLILTNVQDAAIGKLSGPLQREFRKYRPDREFAFYGPV